MGQLFRHPHPSQDLSGFLSSKGSPVSCTVRECPVCSCSTQAGLVERRGASGHSSKARAQRT